MVTDLGAYAMSSGWIQLPVTKEPRVPKFYLFANCIITSALTKKDLNKKVLVVRKIHPNIFCPASYSVHGGKASIHAR